jgi:hypothetical protein
MGHGSEAEANRASACRGRRLGADGNSRAPWSSRRWLTVVAPHERQPPTLELGWWCRAAPGAVVDGFWNRRKRKNRGGLGWRLDDRRERKIMEGGPVARRQVGEEKGRVRSRQHVEENRRGGPSPDHRAAP